LNFEQKVTEVLEELKALLIAKNKKYGNSALEPVRVFSKASPQEQLLVRIDDKLSRIANQQDNEDEDVVTDLLGYLVLLKMAERDESKLTDLKYDFEKELASIENRLMHTPYFLYSHDMEGIKVREIGDKEQRIITFPTIIDFNLWADHKLGVIDEA
jgi:hypothetical protein